MPAPSYDGETCVGVCSNCGRKANIPVAEFKEEIEGRCNGCERLVTWERWEGPVVVV